MLAPESTLRTDGIPTFRSPNKPGATGQSFPCGYDPPIPRRLEAAGGSQSSEAPGPDQGAGRLVQHRSQAGGDVRNPGEDRAAGGTLDFH